VSVVTDGSNRFVIGGIVLVAVCYFGWLASTAGGTAHTETPPSAPATALPPHDGSAEELAAHPSVPPPATFSVIPFAALLGAIALFPLIRRTSHWWEHNKSKFLVAASLGAVTLAYYAFAYGEGVFDHGTHAVSAPGLPAAAAVFRNAIFAEYIPFMTLLFSLYVISGGILIEGRLVGRPGLNASIFAIGAVIANFIGTTGAAMLLIRPVLKANAARKHIVHTIVFFIFVVCNTGGCLLPIGDPPLFLGYLRGVPFAWTLNLLPMWALTNAALVAVYYVWDRFRFLDEDPQALALTNGDPQRFAIRGASNFLWLAGVITAVAVLVPGKEVPGTSWAAPEHFREVVMLSLAGLSLILTSTHVRRGNHFNYGAIVEVAALFVGIFICMQAPIQILNTHGSALGLSRPWQFFWATGTLSSFLDNAPTYVVFFETARSMNMAGNLVQPVGVEFHTLVAISLGSVFMGAMTYIGNGPNFMVKAIAEANNVRMPSFFGYMAYSVLVLVPTFAAVTALFLL